jgi:formate dehydrogenase-N alpha subunit
MTNHWVDMLNADVVLIMGGNPAEDHPIAMNWLRRAKERGTYILHVDPRFNRTSSIADVFAKLRSGTDIAFVGGMIHYAIENNRIHEEYVREYTNASWIVGDDYSFADGLFAGFDPKEKRYDRARWAFAMDGKGQPRRDPTLKHPRCVFQLLKQHFARYDADAVCRITGTPKENYLRVCDLYTSTFAPDRAGTWLYAMGTAQHSHGTQNIRSYAILQLLLGNIGIAGGGVNAMRGESNVQGSTDQGLNYDGLPGYLRLPVERDTDLKTYLSRVTPISYDPANSANWLQNTPKYVVSLLKAWWGEQAASENEFAFDYLPKLGAGFQGQGYAFLALTHAMLAGEVKGLFCFGQNPAVGGANARLIRAGLDKLDWMVVADLFEHETASFWKRPGADPVKIPTEVFVLPACSGVEKEGSIVNSGRWVQWRNQAIKPIADCRPDLDIVDGLVKAMKRAYEKDGVFPEPIRHLAWDYGDHPDPHRVARELNGRFLVDVTEKDGKGFAAGKQVPGFAQLRDDGSTMCGNWIYCGGYTDEGNMAARRDTTDAPNGIGLSPKWAWTWPMNRRILYNRASVNRKGEPFNPRKWVIRWDAEKKIWEGDVADGGMPPGETNPFIMLASGVGQLYSPDLVDGPFPEHYEPVESPVKNPFSKIQSSPCAQVWQSTEFDRYGTPDVFPIVATTYRVSEHWQTGAMSRNMPWLVGLVPDAFVEIGTDLARREGIKNGDRVIVSSARGSVEVYALVTDRFQPFFIEGQMVDEIGLPWHWGYAGMVPGDIVNDLTASVGDPNSYIPESKVFLCNLKRKDRASA